MRKFTPFFQLNKPVEFSVFNRIQSAEARAQIPPLKTEVKNEHPNTIGHTLWLKLQRTYASPHQAKCIENGKFIAKIILLLFFNELCVVGCHIRALMSSSSFPCACAECKYESRLVRCKASNAPIRLLSLFRLWFMQFNFLLCSQCSVRSVHRPYLRLPLYSTTKIVRPHWTIRWTAWSRQNVFHVRNMEIAPRRAIIRYNSTENERYRWAVNKCECKCANPSIAQQSFAGIDDDSAVDAVARVYQ